MLVRIVFFFFFKNSTSVKVHYNVNFTIDFLLDFYLVLVISLNPRAHNMLTIF